MSHSMTVVLKAIYVKYRSVTTTIFGGKLDFDAVVQFSSQFGILVVF